MKKCEILKEKKETKEKLKTHRNQIIQTVHQNEKWTVGGKEEKLYLQ